MQVSFTDRFSDERLNVQIDAKIYLLESFERFFLLQVYTTGYDQNTCRGVFSTEYNKGKIMVPSWVGKAIPSLSRASLCRWKKMLQEKDFEGLACAARFKATSVEADPGL